MLSWLAANGGTIGVAVLLLLVTGSIIAGLVHNRKKENPPVAATAEAVP